MLKYASVLGGQRVAGLGICAFGILIHNAPRGWSPGTIGSQIRDLASRWPRASPPSHSLSHSQRSLSEDPPISACCLLPLSPPPAPSLSASAR